MSVRCTKTEVESPRLRDVDLGFGLKPSIQTRALNADGIQAPFNCRLFFLLEF
jgi:hypothetical protein